MILTDVQLELIHLNLTQALCIRSLKVSYILVYSSISYLSNITTMQYLIIQFFKSIRVLCCAMELALGRYQFFNCLFAIILTRKLTQKIYIAIQLYIYKAYAACMFYIIIPTAHNVNTFGIAVFYSGPMSNITVSLAQPIM